MTVVLSCSLSTTRRHSMHSSHLRQTTWHFPLGKWFCTQLKSVLRSILEAPFLFTLDFKGQAFIPSNNNNQAVTNCLPVGEWSPECVYGVGWVWVWVVCTPAPVCTNTHINVFSVPSIFQDEGRSMNTEEKLERETDSLRTKTLLKVRPSQEETVQVWAWSVSPSPLLQRHTQSHASCIPTHEQLCPLLHASQGYLGSSAETEGPIDQGKTPRLKRHPV
jgi:hypothetical protein